MGNVVSFARNRYKQNSSPLGLSEDGSSRQVWKNPSSEDDVCAILFADGGCFYGPVHDTLCDGFGIMISPDGTEVEGHWEKDALEGNALAIRPDGSQYIHQYRQGELKSEFRVSGSSSPTSGPRKMVRGLSGLIRSSKTSASSSKSITPSSSSDDIQKWLSEGHLGGRLGPSKPKNLDARLNQMSFGHRTRLIAASYASGPATTPPPMYGSTSSSTARIYVPRPPSRVDTWLIPFDQLVMDQKLSSSSNRCADCSTVYKGSWLGKDVIIRVFKNNRLSEYEEKCTELLTKMAKIRHPNIALFMAAAVSDTKLAIVTEYVSNGSLASLTKSNVSLTSQNMLHLSKGIAVGCAYLRKQGFAHKNLKPNNVLIDSSIDVKLTDYFVKEFNELLHESPACTAGLNISYLPPECLRLAPFIPFGVDSASDVYSFGMICWEMLAGRAPYPGLSRAQIRILVGYAGYRETKVHSGTLRGFSKLIEKCTAQEPQDRPTFERVILAINALHSSANSAAEDALITFISGR